MMNSTGYVAPGSMAGRANAAAALAAAAESNINMYNNYYSPTAIISFSIVNTTEFSARVRFIFSTIFILCLEIRCLTLLSS
jgi:hypothetical protein